MENEQFLRFKQEKNFIQNWLSDLMDAMDSQLDRATQIQLIEACGKACFLRYDFKQNIARQGKGDLENLITAYRQNFEIWREGNLVHIRYGETSSGCYCPAARAHPVKEDDLHCECTRMTHQTIFETALGRAFQVEVAESLRRGGQTCHFIVHLDDYVS